MCMKLIEDFKMCKGGRKEYRIKPTIKFQVDRDYYFSFLPTILWCPWIYRMPNIHGVVEIWWLNFHVLIGKWEHLSCNDCTNRFNCKKRKSYFDDIMANGKNCSEFETY